MKATLVLPTLLALAAASPDFQIGPDETVSLKDAAQLRTLSSAYLAAASSYIASKTALPEWTSAQSALSQFQATASGVPKAVTATDTIMKFATTPAWFSAMPTDLQNYINNNIKEQVAIRESVIASVKGSAPAAKSVGLWASGALAALVAGVAIAL